MATIIIVGFLISLVAGLQVVEADPVLVSKYPVTVAIILPKDNLTFANSTFSINFSLGDVAYDKIILNSLIPFTVSVKVDDNYASRKEVYFSISGSSSQEFSIDVANIAEGKHSLHVLAVYSEQSDSFGRHWVELSGLSETINFSVGTIEPAETSTPSPSFPEFPVYVTLPLLAATAIFIACTKRRRKK